MNKYENAIDVVARYCSDYRTGIFPPRNNVYRELDTLFELVEKATPKKPIFNNDILKCSKCHQELDCFYVRCECKAKKETLIFRERSSYNYCPNCGQKIDWSNYDR